MLTALTREVSPDINACELSFLDRQPIDVGRAREQHAAYRQCLGELGVRVLTLPAEPGLPDAVFVEDAAVVVDEVAVVTRMGAASRRREVETVAAALSPFRPLARIVEPGTLEGGDVLRVGRTLYVGLSGRTNRAGAEQLAEALAPYGYRVETVEARGCLHLKSGCSYVGRDTVLANRAWVDMGRIEGVEVIDVPAEEPWGANAVAVGGAVVVPASSPLTRALLEARGFDVRAVDVSELQKAEAGVTCMSVLLAGGPAAQG
jgi:dimethylargininase